jgi:nucleotidyltransferase/DNA polymerase involved in DNA repair
MVKPRIIVHVDMDAFYTSIEQMDCSEYRGKPVVVGADPQQGSGRGVVSAASYEARAYGIHSALPISTAYKRCPHAIYLRPRFKRYSELSVKVMKILDAFSPLVEQISIDEAFLDCSGTEKLFGSNQSLGGHIKDRIKGETGLTASVGMATNKSVAKIASDLHKPDGLCICAPGKEQEFLAPLHIDRLWGAGRKTVDKLEKLGFTLVEHIQNCPKQRLQELFGTYGRRLWELANGIDNRPVVRSSPRKSISQEMTFRRDTDQDSVVEHVLFQLSDSVTRQMRREGIRGRTVNLKIRLAPFDTHTRSHTLAHPVHDMQAVRDTVLRLFRSFDRGGRPVRLVGVGVSNLHRQEEGLVAQLDLFADDQDGLEETDRVLDQMKRLYGEKVTRASFLPPR